MTNLTDEGLRNKAKEVCEWLNLFQDIEAVTKITAALQQVRDAAKKEEREEVCLHIRGKFSYYGCGSHTKESVSEEIITAIRQME